MLKYINKIKEKPEHIRSQYISILLVVCMSIVFSIWLYGITNKISLIKNNNNNIATEQVSEESSSPFAIILNSAKDTYGDVSASVLNASSAFNNIKNIGDNPNVESKVEDVVNDSKVIDLIPVNHNN